MKHAIKILLLFLLLPSIAFSAQKLFKVELQNSQDAAGVVYNRKACIVTIVSKKGIGRAELFRFGKHWPSRMTIRLKLKSLSSFGMSDGNIRFNTSANSPRKTPYWKISKNKKRSDKPDGVLDVAITKNKGFYEIRVPQKLLESNPKQIGFGWIDLFRV